jgi:chromosome segregation ATPase
MQIGIAQIIALIGASASVICTVIVGALSFFLKKTLAGLEEADKKNAARIDKVEEKLSKVEDKVEEKLSKAEDKFNDLKADLPLLYVTREDYIRIMNRVEDKLDKLLYSCEAGNTTKGKEA